MTGKYLKLFPKPLLADLIAGRWLPVVGAGMSLNAKLPFGKKMPLWDKLGEIIGADLDDFSATGALDAISAFQHEFGRSKLIEQLISVLHIHEAQPGRAHEAFCDLAFDIVCTTNFDFLLERQYEAAPRQIYTVVDEDQLSVNGSSAGTILLKLHGDLRHPGRLVVTEEDYDGFLNKYPLLATYLANLLITKSAVFIGYSLDDPDFRQVWNIVTSRLGKSRRMAYALMVDASASEVARFERRGVKVINLPGSKDRYGEILADAFAELQNHWRENVISASKVTEEEPLRELLLPRGAPTRLCFFSIPIDRLSLYRSEVFPVVQAMGFVPVTADDIISPGDNVNAKIDALIDRAAVMVVEPSTQWTRAELNMALAQNNRNGRRELKTIIVGAPDAKLPPELNSTSKVVLNRDLLESDPSTFVLALGGMLSAFAKDLGADQVSEPNRLLAQGEYRAAVISAMTLLEIRLRSAVNPYASANGYRADTLRTLIAVATNEQLIAPEWKNKFEAWIRLRNVVVHTEKAVTRVQAAEIVDGVARVLATLGELPAA